MGYQTITAHRDELKGGLEVPIRIGVFYRLEARFVLLVGICQKQAQLGKLLRSSYSSWRDLPAQPKPCRAKIWQVWGAGARSGCITCVPAESTWITSDK